MKTCLTVCLTALAMALQGVETNADYQAGESSSVLLTPELKALADGMFGADAAEKILHAVELNMTKYDLDMQSPAGRKAWHGRLHHEIVDTNGLFKIEVYTNETTGATWRYRQPYAAPQFRQTVKKTVVMTNGIPAKLAAARLRRASEKEVVSNVTVTVEANK